MSPGYLIAMWANILTILNLFILEAMLSIDNAAVLAVMVSGLPGNDGKKALKWGIWGAYILRGFCLLIAGILVSWWPLKVAGGAFLVYLFYGHITKAVDTVEEDLKRGREDSRIYQWFKQHTGLNDLWLTIILVELLDLSFSMDNIFAAVAMSPHMWVIITGVFMGILAMRFVAGGFMVLMKKYPSLTNSAFIVILLLGIKLILSGIVDGMPGAVWAKSILSNHKTDLIFSGCMMLIFFIPLLLPNGKRKDDTPDGPTWSIHDVH